MLSVLTITIEISNVPQRAQVNETDIPYPHHYGYGAGRRMCPGLHLAERNMWRIAAKLLWAFDISEWEDPTTGGVIHLDKDAYTSAILMCPLPFKVKITPRSPEHLACIEKDLSSAMEFMSRWN